MRVSYISLLTTVFFTATAFAKQWTSIRTPSSATAFYNLPIYTIYFSSDSANADLLRELAVTNKMGIQLALMALGKPVRSEVKVLANKSLEYHKKIEKELKQIASSKQFSYEDELLDHDKDDIGKLFKLKGALFEKSFLNLSNDNQRKLLTLYKKAQLRIEDAEIASFTIAVTPELEAHNAAVKLLRTTIK